LRPDPGQKFKDATISFIYEISPLMGLKIGKATIRFAYIAYAQITISIPIIIAMSAARLNNISRMGISSDEA
jgi:hypothetical protein